MSSPLAPSRRFAEMVAELERVMQTNLPTINRETTTALLACIREQQAALVALCGPTPAGMQPETTRWETARNVLAKWRIE